MSRYFIAHLPGPNIKGYHRAITHQIGGHFGIDIDTTSAHITLKAPFEADSEQIEKLKAELLLFSKEYQVSHKNGLSFSVNGFGHLGRLLITLDVIHSIQMEVLATKLQDMLKGFPWITWSKHEPIFHFHITVVKGVTKEFDDIWWHLSEKSVPQFDCYLDDFALLRSEDGVWLVDSVYRLV